MRGIARVGLALGGCVVALTIVGSLEIAAMPQRQGGAQPPPASRRLLFLTHAGLSKHTSLGPAAQSVMALGTTGGTRLRIRAKGRTGRALVSVPIATLKEAWEAGLPRIAAGQPG